MRNLIPSLLTSSVLVAVLVAWAPARAGAGTELRQVHLKPEITVSGPTVLLGDLFEGVDAGTDTVVGEAPPPGRRSSFSSRRIATIARAHGLAWQPRRTERRVNVTRSGKMVRRDVIVAALTESLRDLGVGENLQLQIAHRRLALYLVDGEQAELDVEITDFNRTTRRFQSRVRLAATTTAAGDAITVAGRAFRIVEVPVLRGTLTRGTLIRDADIEWRSVRITRVGQDTVREAEDIVGKEANRRLRAGKPLRNRDLRDAVVVAKGSLVTVALEAPGMQLSATGRALENGSDGALIRVMNVQSKRTIQAVVIGPNRVRVPYR